MARAVKRTKEDRDFSPGAIQSPSDPEATYRKKAGKDHKGYVANIEESVGHDGSLITDYQYENNLYSDSAFLKDNLNRQEKSDEKITMVTDGAYFSADNINLADEKNIDLVTTGLTGHGTKEIHADFEFDEDGKLLKCANGYAPLSCTPRTGNDSLRVSFPKSCCMNCPFKDQCNPKFYKKVAKFNISPKSVVRARHLKRMKEASYENYTRLRNGVETIPSNLRNNFHLEKLPRGKQRGKFFFGLKVMALNFRKLFNFRKGLIQCAENPLLA